MNKNTFNVEFFLYNINNIMYELYDQCYSVWYINILYYYINYT
jgi:hypothetical protein